MISYDLTLSDRHKYERDGYVVLPGLISDQAAAACRLEVLSVVGAIGLGTTKLRQSTQYLKGSQLDALVNSAGLARVAKGLIEGSAHVYMPFTAVKSADGGGEFHFHQDNQYTQFDGPGINFWFALQPMSEENGCLWIAPRSHLRGTLPSTPSPDGDQHRQTKDVPDDAIPIVMEAGDCVAFSRLTIHGSGRNESADHRVAYAIQFHREDARRLVDDEWKMIRDYPRWHVGPVESISPPNNE